MVLDVESCEEGGIGWYVAAQRDAIIRNRAKQLGGQKASVSSRYRVKVVQRCVIIIIRRQRAINSNA